MSTAPVSVAVPVSAPVTYPAGTVTYVGPPVPTEGPFPFPEFASDPAAIDEGRGSLGSPVVSNDCCLMHMDDII